MTTEWQVMWAGVGVVVVGGLGLLLAIFFMLTDARAEHAEDEERAKLAHVAALEEARRRKYAAWLARVAKRHARIVGGTAVAVVLASVAIYADDPNGACMEASLRAMCGDLWEVCWWTLGCWALPG